MDYKILWTDMHSNIHHEQMNELPQWFDQVQKMMDFWPIAYYPYTMRKDETGLGVEDRYPLDVIEKRLGSAARVYGESQRRRIPDVYGLRVAGRRPGRRSQCFLQGQPAEDGISAALCGSG